MKTKFSKTDLGCVIGDDWDIFGNRIRESDDGLYLTGNGEPEKVLPFPFTLEQFRAFFDWCPTFQWEAIESVFTNDDGSLDDAAIDRLNPASGAADLVRAVLATHDAEFQMAWGMHEQIDRCKAQIERWERLEQNAPTPSEAIAAEQKLAGLRAELAGLLSQLSGVMQEHLQAAPSPAPASAEHVEPVQAEQASHARATTEQRRARRFQMCIDAGLKMPDNDYAPLPRGIAEVAKREGITRQSLAEDLKAHIRRLYGR